MEVTDSRGFQFSVRQMLVLVVYAAVGAAVMTPFVMTGNNSGSSWILVAFLGSVIVPLVWTAMVLATTRANARRDWFVHALLLWSTVSILVLTALIACSPLVPALWGLWLSGPDSNFSWVTVYRARGIDLTYCLVLLFGERMSLHWVSPYLAVSLLLAIGSVFLLFRAVPGRCGECGRWRRVRSGKIGCEAKSACLACGAVFRRSDGRWTTVLPT